MHILSRSLIAIAVVFTILLAIGNRGLVSVTLDPLPVQIDGPLYAFLIVSCFVGVIAGGFAGWVASLKWRRVARRQTREMATLEQRLKTFRSAGGDQNQPPPAPATPDDPGPEPKQSLAQKS